jgi:small subunit ribosomal protein S11
MASKLISRSASSSSLQQCRRLLLRQQKQIDHFSTSTKEAADKFSNFAASLRSSGVVGQALGTSTPQEQSLRDIQQQKQRDEAQSRRQRTPLVARRTLSQDLMDAKRSAELGMANQSSTTDIFGELHHLHLFARRHNTHITLTKPNREPILSLSAGNINFKKANRGSFDAAYQLVTYAITQIVERGILQEIEKLEIVLRGYGAGREALQKVLLGTEGQLVKYKVYRITESTRLKFGGTKSHNVRRL